MFEARAWRFDHPSCRVLLFGLGTPTNIQIGHRVKHQVFHGFLRQSYGPSPDSLGGGHVRRGLCLVGDAAGRCDLELGAEIGALQAAKTDLGRDRTWTDPFSTALHGGCGSDPD